MINEEDARIGVGEILALPQGSKPTPFLKRSLLKHHSMSIQDRSSLEYKAGKGFVSTHKMGKGLDGGSSLSR